MNEFNEIDDLDAIEQGGANLQTVKLSNLYNVIVGGFELDSGIRTYLCSVKVDELDQDISFYEELTKDKSWPVSQIIQREVDDLRVSNISKSYILGEGRPVKYFPPIIIAILPKEEDGQIKLHFKKSNSVDADIRNLIFEKSIFRDNVKLKDYFLNCDNLTKTENLFLLNVSKVFDLNILCWNKSDYYAIVIDGQHRLDALLKSKEEDPKIGDFRQDVAFLDFSEYVINNEGKDSSLSPVEVVRRVFIDINTNAKKVGIVRQILMDDKDLASLMVQSIVESVNPDGTDKCNVKYIKPELVDWYGKSLKHQIPHVTGILSLYQIFNDYLVQNSLNSIDDHRSKSKVRKWVKSMNDRFFIDSLIDDKKLDVTKLEKDERKYLESIKLNDELNEDYGDEFKESELFTYDYRVLDIANERFNDVYAESFVKVFNEFLPYKNIYKIIEQQQGFVKGNVLNTALIASPNKFKNSSTLRSELSNIRALIKSEIDEKLFLSFTVLFQKVLFLNLIQRFDMVNSLEMRNEDSLEITTTYLNEINSLITHCLQKDVSLFGFKDSLNIIIDESDDLSELGTIATSFWDGIIYENGNIIYNTQGIRTLSAFFDLILDVMKNKDDKNYQPVSVSKIPYVESRIKRIIYKQYNTISDEEVSELTCKIIDLKNEFIINYFNIEN
jgi:hypothetical protein